MLRRSLVTLLIPFIVATGVSAQEKTYQGKVSKGARLDPSDPITAVGAETYLGFLKSSQQTVTVGCNPKADFEGCAVNPATGKYERQALAVCDRVAAVQVEITRQSGKKEQLVAGKGTVAFFNIAMFPLRAALEGAKTRTGLFGDLSLQTDRFKTHLMNPPEKVTIDLGGPGHSWAKDDVLKIQVTCSDAHNAMN